MGVNPVPVAIPREIELNGVKFRPRDISRVFNKEVTSAVDFFLLYYPIRVLSNINLVVREFMTRLFPDNPGSLVF